MGEDKERALCKKDIVKLAVKLEDDQLKRNTQEEMEPYEGECNERYG